jgi:hypothetical protein
MWYAWTSAPILGDLLTMVVEVRSGFSFEILPGAKIRPSSIDHEVELDQDGTRRLVKATRLSSEAQNWLNSLEPGYVGSLPLEKGERISVNPEGVAITFRAQGLDHALGRAKTLLDFAALLPKQKSHTLPRKLRGVAPLIRAWAISDDAKREARLEAAARPDLEVLVSTWRSHVDLINATINQRPTSNLSARLMAFAEAAQEAELRLTRGAL